MLKMDNPDKVAQDVQNMSKAANMASSAYLSANKTATEYMQPQTIADGPRYQSKPVVSPRDFHFDKGYVRILPGILQVAQMVLDVLAIFCLYISSLPSSSKRNFFMVVAWTGLVVTAILFLVYAFHINEKVKRFPWGKFEMGFTVILTAFYALAFLLLAVQAGKDGGWIAATVFSFFAVVLYGFNAFEMVRAWQSDVSGP